MEKIIKDQDGNVINIGEWDYKIITDESGQEKITNPLPDGAYEEQAEIETLEDGSRVLASESYAAKRRNAYPSIEDQLDMRFWDEINGTNNLQTVIQAVKDQYPKS